MATKSVKNKNDYQQIADLLRAMAHPLRLQMLLGLCQNECNVNKVWQRLNISQPLASQHLNRMRRAGLVTTERRGKEICYNVTDVRVRAILNRFCDLFSLDANQK